MTLTRRRFSLKTCFSFLSAKCSEPSWIIHLESKTVNRSTGESTFLFLFCFVLMNMGKIIQLFLLVFINLFASLMIAGLTLSSSSSSSSSSANWMVLFLLASTALAHVSSTIPLTRLSRPSKRARLSERIKKKKAHIQPHRNSSRHLKKTESFLFLQF